MKIRFQYLIYLFRHKWFVFWACIEFGVPLWRAVIHDWSKLTPAEFLPYAQNWFWTKEQKNDETIREGGLVGNIYEAIPFGKLISDRYTVALNHHFHNNPHHWDYWVVHKVGEKPWGLPMPETYVREMLADWKGAGLAKNDKNDVVAWYKKNGRGFIIRDETRILIEKLLGINNG